MGIKDAMADFGKMGASVSEGLPLVVTPAILQWRANGRVITPEAIAHVNEVRMARATRPDGSRPGDDGSDRIRPSALGKCERMQILSFLGYESDPFDEKLLDIMESGVFAHERWQERLLSIGLAEHIEVPIKGIGWPLKGSMDALLTDNSVFEFKTASEFAYRKVVGSKGQAGTGPKREHLFQAGAYMDAWECEEASIVYENRHWPDEFKEFRIAYTDDLRAQVAAYKKRMNTYIARRQLPMILTDCLSGTGTQFNDCSKHGACLTAIWP